MAQDIWDALPDYEHNFRDCQDAAKALYTAGYRKQIAGNWFIREYEFFTCSECGHDYWNGCDSTAEAKERLTEGKCPNFCPNCGAMMKGDSNG